MNPEDKYNIKYWKVLKNIKDKILLSDHNLIEYKIYSGILIVGYDEPSQEEELIILKKIEREQGIKIKQDATNLVYTGLIDLKLDLLVLPKFDEIYNKYKSMNTEFNIKKHEKVGILNTGKNNTFIGNTFHGHDMSIKSETSTLTKDNEFFTNSKKENNKEWYEKPIGIVLLAVTGGIVVAGIIFWLGWN
jgi:hypothetical protein